jgi:hypothetical protein
LKLTELFEETRETQDTFIDRTYWGITKDFKGKVWIYDSKADRLDRTKKPKAVWTPEQAKAYAATLKTEPEAVETPETPQKSIIAEIMQICEEDLEKGWTRKEWRDSITGELKHNFENNERKKNGA